MFIVPKSMRKVGDEQCCTVLRQLHGVDSKHSCKLLSKYNVNYICAKLLETSTVACLHNNTKDGQFYIEKL